MDPTQKRALLATIYASYLRSLERRPLVTKACTSAVLALLEERSAQLITGKRRPGRAERLALFGLFVRGPLGHALYEMVGRLFPGSSLLHSVGQLLAVNLLVAPVQTAAYYAGLAAIDGKPPAAVWASVKANMWPTMVVTWKYFPLVQVLTLKLLPQPMWVPFFNLLGLLFGVYLNVAEARRAAQR